MADNPQPPVEARHREAAADAVRAYRGSRDNNWQQRIRAGLCDDGEMVQAFARFEQSLTPAPTGERREALVSLLCKLVDLSEETPSAERRLGLIDVTADAILSLPPEPASTGAAIPRDNDGQEQEAFEEWARSECMDLTTHPLHWLFLNELTAKARAGWRGALKYVAAVVDTPKADQPRAEVIITQEQRVEDFVCRIMDATPNGEWIEVKFHPNGDWSVGKPRAEAGEIERLHGVLTKYAVNMEYDYPGDTPVPCGLWCDLCKEHVEEDGSGHDPACLLALTQDRPI